jgi:hypothetical protein
VGSFMRGSVFDGFGRRDSSRVGASPELTEPTGIGGEVLALAGVSTCSVHSVRVGSEACG